jgi:hypothetical protein
MKKIFILGTFALLSTTLFSCSADENETTDKNAEAKKAITNTTPVADDGPADDPVPIKPPKN